MRRLAPLLLALLAAPAFAQDLRDLNELALSWTRGEFVSPLFCEVGDQARRGLRRVVIEPGPRHVQPPANQLRFFPLTLPEGARCYTDTGGSQHNVAGALLFRLNSISRPDIAGHDFVDALKREGGFSFEIRKGTLTVDGEPVEFTGGKAHFEQVQRGSDAHRRMADLPDTRKLHLRLEAKSGARLEFDLAQAGIR